MSAFGTAAFQGTGDRSAPSLNVTVNTAIGDLIIVAAGWSDSGTASVSDSAGNTYVPDTERTLGIAGFGQFFYCLGATKASASNVITVTFTNTGNNYETLAAWDFPLTGATAVFDVSADSDGAGDATTAPYSTTGNDEAAVVFALDGFGTDHYAAEAGYTLDGSFGTFSGAEHIVFSSPQTDITSSFSAAPNTSHAIAIAFKANATPVKKKRGTRSK